MKLVRVLTMVKLNKSLFIVDEKSVSSVQAVVGLSADIVHGWVGHVLLSLEIRNITRNLFLGFSKSSACSIGYLLPLLSWLRFLLWDVCCRVVASVSECERINRDSLHGHPN